MDAPPADAVLIAVALAGLVGMLYVLASHLDRGRSMHSLRCEVTRLRIEYLARLKAMDLNKGPEVVPADQDEQIRFLLGTPGVDAGGDEAAEPAATAGTIGGGAAGAGGRDASERMAA